MPSERNRMTQTMSREWAFEADPKVRHVATVAKGQPVPLEDICPPPGLDGRNGIFRCIERCEFDAQTDLGAIKFWITKTSKTDATAKSRRSAAERLVNWAYLVHGKALSSFDQTDFSAFTRFLAAPMPMDSWVGPRAARGTVEWRPFTQPLGASSLLTTVAHLQSMVRCFADNRYATLRIAQEYRSLEHGIAQSAVAVYCLKTPDFAAPLPLDEWQWIRRVLENAEGTQIELARRLFVELLAYCSLQSRQILDLRRSDVFEPSATVPVWVLKVQGRPTWRGGEYMIAPPPLGWTLGCWLKDGFSSASPLEQHFCDASSPRLLPLNKKTAGCIVRTVCHEASLLADEAGYSFIAQRLISRNLASIRQMLAPPHSARALERYMKPWNPFCSQADEVARMLEQLQWRRSEIEAYWAPPSASCSELACTPNAQKPF